MMREFDEIVERTRGWLGGARCRLSLHNEVGDFGLLRRRKTLLTDPIEYVVASEHIDFRGRKFGAIICKPSVESNVDPVMLRWVDGLLMVKSSLTFHPDQLVGLSHLSGLILERVHNRILPVIDEITKQS